MPILPADVVGRPNSSERRKVTRLRMGLRFARAQARIAGDFKQADAISFVLDDDDLFDEVLASAEQDSKLVAALEDERPPRDWAGFFQAVAEFFKAILPIILQLIGALSVADVETSEVDSVAAAISASAEASRFEGLREARELVGLMRQVRASVDLSTISDFFQWVMRKTKTEEFLDALAGAKLLAKSAGLTNLIELIEFIERAVVSPTASGMSDWLVVDAAIRQAVDEAKRQPLAHGVHASSINWALLLEVVQLVASLIRQGRGQLAAA